MLENIKKIFNKKRKTKEKEAIYTSTSNASTSNIKDINEIKNKEAIFVEKEEVMERNIVRTRLNAYVIKNDEEDFRMMEYDMNSGEVLWIEGKIFNNLRGLDRVRWSPSSGSATVFYGYIKQEENGEKLVSSVYIMNFISKHKNNGTLGDIIYSMKDSTVTINPKIKGTAKPVVFYIYSVCGLVEIDRELSKIGLTLIKE